MRVFSILFVILTLIIGSGCSKNDSDIGPYLTEIVTVSRTAQSITFIQDQTHLTLIPEKVSNEYSLFLTGDRVLLYYSPESRVENTQTIRILSAGQILTKKVTPLSSDSLSRLPDHPIKLESVWMSDLYINLRFVYDYYDTPHSVNLFYNPDASTSDTLRLQLLHNSNNDPKGVEVRSYASFSIEQLLYRYPSSHIAIRINSSNYGIKDFIVK